MHAGESVGVKLGHECNNTHELQINALGSATQHQLHNDQCQIDRHQ